MDQLVVGDISFIMLALFSVAATILIIYVSDNDGLKGKIVAMIVGAVMLTIIASWLRPIFEMIRNISERMGVSDIYLKILFKAILIAYISEFAFKICKDGGVDATAYKIRLAGQIAIMILSAPILFAVIDLITQLM